MVLIMMFCRVGLCGRLCGVKEMMDSMGRRVEKENKNVSARSPWALRFNRVGLLVFQPVTLHQ